MHSSGAVILKMFDEVEILKELKDDTITLIHSTSSIKPIKKLIEVHELIDLSLVIESSFSDYKDSPPLSPTLLKDMNSLRAELVVFHRLEFAPVTKLDAFSAKMVCLFHVASRGLHSA